MTQQTDSPLEDVKRYMVAVIVAVATDGGKNIHYDESNLFHRLVMREFETKYWPMVEEMIQEATQ